jgi:hypothetical protein
MLKPDKAHTLRAGLTLLEVERQLGIPGAADILHLEAAPRYRTPEGLAGLRLQAACGRCRHAGHRRARQTLERQVHHVIVMRQHELPGVIPALDFVKRFLARPRPEDSVAAAPCKESRQGAG